jgi:predicted Fe-Mo cluster-binding NifX family protein
MTDASATNDAPSCVPGHLEGRLERVDHQMISGWAADITAPELAVELEVLINDVSAGTLPARLLRPDLVKAPFGSGHHGFELRLSNGLPGVVEHVVRVRRAIDGAELSGSPYTLARTAAPDEITPQTVAEALQRAAATASGEERDALIMLLARQAAELLFAHGTALSDPQAALVARWSTSPVTVAADNRPRALFIDEGVPDPSRDAGSNAAISHMRALQRLGLRVDFIAAYSLGRAGARSEALEAAGITCWHAPWIGSVEEVLRRLGESVDVVYLHRFAIMQRYGALVRRWCPKARLLYCVADLHHLRLARQLAVEAGGRAESAGMTGPSAGLRIAELLAVQGADAVITHSSFEAELLRREAPEAEVHMIPWTVEANPTSVPFTDRKGVAFVGSYGHPPNLDAAHSLVEVIMKLVWAKDPAIPCVLAGSDLPASLRQAAERAPAGGVIVLGHVPSLHDVWDRVRLTVAPLRYGAGLKGKVLDSLAGGIPCVCSPMAAEGMDLPETLSDLVAATPEAIAATIVRLHADGTANAALVEAGLDWVRAALAPARIDEALGKATKIQRG